MKTGKHINVQQQGLWHIDKMEFWVPIKTDEVFQRMFDLKKAHNI